MSDLKIDVNISDIARQFGDIQKQVESDLKKSVSGLASSTHAKLLELATDNLNSLQKIYKDAVSFERLDDNLWIVALDEKAMFIEEGRKSGFMQELLDSPKAKTNKKGEKYAVIPFEHSKPPSQQSEKAQDLTNQIRKELKRRDIPYKKLEYNTDGSPKLGLIHRFDVESARLKPEHKNDPLKGVAVYQRKGSDGNIRRDIMTFRIISDKHKSEGIWVHPGMEAKNLMDKAWEWAQNEWENKILPEVLNKYE
jgi:hypothetical protein